MEKKQAREMLDVNQTDLAGILCISKSHLSRIPKLTEAQVKIVQGEMAKRILVDAVTTIERLESEKLQLETRLAEVLRVAGVTLPESSQVQ